MEDKYTTIKYIENKTRKGDTAGIIVGVGSSYIRICTMERHGADAEVALSLEMTEELIKAINTAIESIPSDYTTIKCIESKNCDGDNAGITVSAGSSFVRIYVTERYYGAEVVLLWSSIFVTL